MSKPHLQECKTLSDAVRFGFTIHIYCVGPNCAHGRVVPAEPLAALFRARCWPDDFAAVKLKMRCDRCRERSPVVIASDKPVDSRPIGPANGAEYKALVKRLRD